MLTSGGLLRWSLAGGRGVVAPLSPVAVLAMTRRHEARPESLRGPQPHLVRAQQRTVRMEGQGNHGITVTSFSPNSMAKST